MHKILLYQDRSLDGETRTALDIDEVPTLEHRVPGDGPPDPVTLWDWYLLCEGARLPTDPEKVVRWLREQGPVVRAELTRLAEKVETAVDPGEWPLLWDVARPPRGVRMRLFCHAIRPVTLRQLATMLRDVRDRWEELLSLLPTARAASA